MPDLADTAAAEDSLVESHMGLARSLARKCSGHGVDDDELESDAMLALFRAAQYYRGNGHSPDTFHPWAKLCITRALRQKVVNAPLAHLSNVPVALRDAAKKCHAAALLLAKRGILRPNANQIAGEALLDVEIVELVLDIPGLIVRQSLIEWIEDKGTRAGEPTIVPLFPVKAFDPQSACPHREPIPDGSPFCCMVCHGSGMDKHPALRRSPLTDPKPEQKRGTGSETLDATLARPEGVTRRQRRKASAKNPTCTGEH